VHSVRSVLSELFLYKEQSFIDGNLKEWVGGKENMLFKKERIEYKERVAKLGNKSDEAMNR
jgi:hypothetical protein